VVRRQGAIGAVRGGKAMAMAREENYWLKTVPRRRVLSGGALAVAALGLAACGSSNNGGNKGAQNTSNSSGNTSAQSTSNSATRQATSASSPAAAGRVATATAGTALNQQQGGRLVWATNADLVPVSLPYSASVWLFPLQYGVYDYLTKYKGFTLDSEPRMAMGWEQPSPMQMTLKLRDGLKWHTGEAVTAQDLVFNFDHIKAPESRSGVKSLAQRVTAAAPDAKTVTLTLSEPLPGIFDLFDYMPVAHPPTFGDLATAKQIIGSGPFKFKEWIPGTHVLIERNKEWWKPNRPFLDEVEWKLYPQDSLATAMEAGEIDYTASLNFTDAVRLGKTNNNKLIKGSEGFTFLYLSCNVEHPALQDKRVRQALNFALDRKRVSDEIMLGLTGPKVLPFPEYSPGYDKGQAGSVTYDPAKAKALLSQAGYSSSAAEIPLSFSAAIPQTEGIMTILQGDLKKLGVAAKIDKLESSVYIDRYIKKTLPGGMSFLLGYAGMYPSTFMLSIFDVPNIFHKTDDTYTSTMTDSFKKANVKDTFAEAVKGFNQYLIDDAFIMPVVANLQPHMISKRVQGFNINVVDDILLEEISVTKA